MDECYPNYCLIKFGSSKIAAESLLPLNEAYRLIVIENNSFMDSDEKIYINGSPLSLATDGLGNYILQVIYVTSDYQDTSYFVFDGNEYIINSWDNRYILHVDLLNEDNNIADNVIIYGMPLALNNKNMLIINDTGLNINDADEIDSVYIGGAPLTKARFGNNWYLVIDKN